VGQHIEGLGEVAFVHEVPFDTRGEDGKGRPWSLLENQDFFLTLLPQGATVELEMTMSAEDLRDLCGCEDVAFGFQPAGGYVYFKDSDPDGGQGRDGG
jgi:hypothetical protein